MASLNAASKPAQVRVARRSPAYWRVTIDNPPINVMGPEMVRQFQDVINALEADEHVKVVVFDSAVDDYFLNHSDFLARLEDLTAMPAGPTGLPPWPDFLVRLTRAPVASIALIRGRATGNGSETHARLRHEFRQPRKGSHFAMGGGRRNGRRRRPDGPATQSHRPKPRARGAAEFGRPQRQTRPRPTATSIARYPTPIWMRS